MKNMRWRILLLAVAIGALHTANLQAQFFPLPAPQPVPVPQLPWLHEGLMLTSTWAEYIAPGVSTDFTEDINGNWVDASGTRYYASPRQGTSASGLNQTLITCIDGDKTALCCTGFGDSQLLGLADPVPLAGHTMAFVGTTDAPSYWKDPAKLAALQSDLPHGLFISRVQWRNGGQLHDALRIQLKTAQSYNVEIYDLKTGGCLHFASISVTAPPQMVAPGEVPQGDMIMTQGDFVSARDVIVPWANEPIPAVLKNAPALHYRGSVQIIQSALPPIPNVLESDFTLQNKGAGWMQYALSIQQQYQGAPPLPPTNVQVVFGRSGMLNPWAGPIALSKLQQGQVLDSDPVSKMKFTVSQIGASTITITYANGSGGWEDEYSRRTGVLARQSYVNRLARQVTTVSLQQ